VRVVSETNKGGKKKMVGGKGKDIGVAGDGVRGVGGLKEVQQERRGKRA